MTMPNTPLVHELNITHGGMIATFIDSWGGVPLQAQQFQKGMLP
ncbi:hypothetical protein [Peribacillus simplex]|nr:hypothetical protein [Peribacillus simplex]